MRAFDCEETGNRRYALVFHKKTSEKDYCIIGTIDEAYYSEGVIDLKNSKFFKYLHLFKKK